MTDAKLLKIRRLCESEIQASTRIALDNLKMDEAPESARRARFVRAAYREVLRIIDESDEVVK